jgi:hypothetical protein
MTGSRPSPRVWGGSKKGGLAPKPLARLPTSFQRGRSETASLWPEVRAASRWVHRAAHLLRNDDHCPGTTLKRRLGGRLGAMRRHRAVAGALAPALEQFLKVSQSYWPGLFHCDEIPDLPRTNTDLEQGFGAHRYHERRATGCKGASPALVLRGSVQLIAAMATRLHTFVAWELAPEEVNDWRALRRERDTRRHRRTLRLRFRRNPDAYLAELEAALLKLTLPP